MRIATPHEPDHGFLTDMADHVRQELREGYYDNRPQASLGLLLRPPRLDEAVRQARASPAILVELKHASPGYGEDSVPEVGPEEFLASARRAGVDGLSVIPQPHVFGGSLEEFGAVAQSSPYPVLFKDFVVSIDQIEAAAAWGAAAVLLIARLDSLGLTEVPLDALVDAAHEHDIEALVEVHSPEELPLALGSNPDLLGVNARDLQTLEVSTLSAARVLAEARETGLPLVGMSGITGPDAVRDYTAAGAGAVLVGTAYLRAEDRAAFVAHLRSGGPG